MYELELKTKPVYKCLITQRCACMKGKHVTRQFCSQLLLQGTLFFKYLSILVPGTRDILGQRCVYLALDETLVYPHLSHQRMVLSIIL